MAKSITQYNECNLLFVDIENMWIIFFRQTETVLSQKMEYFQLPGKHVVTEKEERGVWGPSPNNNVKMNVYDRINEYPPPPDYNW